MSDAPEKDEDATEDPSDRRLEEARREGRIPLSREAVHTGALVIGAAVLAAAAPSLTTALVTSMRGALSSPGLLFQMCARAALLGVGVVAAVAAAAVVATMVQTKGGVWPQLLVPKGDRLFSTQRLTHTFSREGAVDIGVSGLKALGLLAVGLASLRPHLGELRNLLVAPVAGILPGIAHVLAGVVPRVVLALVALAALDVFLVRRRYTNKMRMKREDLKREHKEDEGDPQIKGKRKRKHRELVQGRVAVEVPRADAIVVNPTHIAVAIRYRKKSDTAPRVTAKGKGRHAEVMRELAAQHGIPVVRDIPLARFLVKRVKVGQEVPSDVYKSVAAVLAYVYKITGRVPGTGAE